MDLLDFRKILSKFCFMDESGSLGVKAQKYFTVGILKMGMPYFLQSKISFERSKRNFHDEMKFNKISDNNIAFYKFVIDCVFETKDINFYSYTCNTNSNFFLKEFGKNIWQAYEKLTLKLLDKTLKRKEILILIADHIQTPKDIKFEVDVKEKFNKTKNSLVLAGVARFDSKTNDLLQVVDLLIGCITYDIKLKEGMIAGSPLKIELLNYFKQRLGVTDFSEDFKNANFDICFDESVEQNNKNKTKPNEKGLSS